jgi:hypothetical protein
MCNQLCSEVYWKDAKHDYPPKPCSNGCDKKKPGHKVHLCVAHIYK